MSKSEASRVLQVSRATIDRLIRKGELVMYKDEDGVAGVTTASVEQVQHARAKKDELPSSEKVADGALSVSEAAKRLGKHYSAVYALIQNAAIKAVKSGRSWQVDAKSVAAYLQAQA